MLLDTSGLLCHQYSGEDQHPQALSLFESSGRKLTHSYVLAEFLALVTERRLNRGQVQRRMGDDAREGRFWVDDLGHSVPDPPSQYSFARSHSGQFPFGDDPGGAALTRPSRRFALETDLVVVQPTPLPAIMELAEQARDYARQAKAENTRRAYRSDWNDFDAWCGTHRLSSLPAVAETVALYLSRLAQTHKCSTLQRRLSAISQAHAAQGMESPTKTALVRAVWQGIRRARGVAPEGKEPAVTEILRRMVAALPDNLLGVRDRALLVVGFAGAFRRSELVGLNREDVVFSSEGVTITLRRSKTDQEGEGRKIGLPYGSRLETCPVRSLQAWMNASSAPSPAPADAASEPPLYNVREAPLFVGINRHGTRLPKRLSGNAVASIVKRYALAVGLDAARFAGHSLRSGLATAAAQAGVSERAIMAQTGHRSTAMVRRYIRDGSLFRRTPPRQWGYETL